MAEPFAFVLDEIDPEFLSSGAAGLGGLALAGTLLTAHPSSFASFSAINYVAYAFIGGRGAILGPVVGVMRISEQVGQAFRFDVGL